MKTFASDVCSATNSQGTSCGLPFHYMVHGLICKHTLDSEGVLKL